MSEAGGRQRCHTSGDEHWNRQDVGYGARNYSRDENYEVALMWAIKSPLSPDESDDIFKRCRRARWAGASSPTTDRLMDSQTDDALTRRTRSTAPPGASCGGAQPSAPITKHRPWPLLPIETAFRRHGTNRATSAVVRLCNRDRCRRVHAGAALPSLSAPWPAERRFAVTRKRNVRAAIPTELGSLL
jgi:hypothetical protein